MGRLGTYKVELKGLKEASATYNWVVGNDFFALVEGEDVQKGNVNVQLTVTKEAGLFNLDFELEGNAIVSCDRCLDDLTLEAEATGVMVVYFGDEDKPFDGEEVTLQRGDEFSIAQFVYDSIMLDLPIVRMHEPEDCKPEMLARISGVTE